MPSSDPAPERTADTGFLAHREGDATHAHRGRDPSKALGWSLALVLGFGAVEALVGWLSGSLALMSDAVHMVTDGMALGLAWFAQRIAQRAPTESHSFGYERVEALAAFVNGLFYLVLLGVIALEAVGRMVHPVPLRADWAFPVAVIGLVINGIMWRMLQADSDRLNTRAAMLHVIGDFAGSVTAIVAIGLAWWTGWTRFDALLALAISLVMLFSTSRVLRDSSRVLMNAAPESVDVGEAGRALRALAGVTDVHDLHVWSLGSGHTALAAHLTLERIEAWPQILARARAVMRERFGIEHLTLQPEAAAGGDVGRQLQRALAERDAALAQALQAEQQRDASGELALRYERALEEERRAVVRELQDDLGRHATAIRTMASTFENRLAEREPSLAQLASLMVRNTDALFAAIRAMVQRVRPEAFDRGGLLDGIRALVDDWRLRQPAMRFELLIEPADSQAFGFGPPEVEEAAYRIVSEALENAVTHSRAGTVVVSVHRDAGALSLQVSDDGRGMPRGDTPEGPGLRAMRERAASVAGSVVVGTGEAGGAEVLVKLPWPSATV
jgi:cobalt-zinc-cadmium efflux system protein